MLMSDDEHDARGEDQGRGEERDVPGHPDQHLPASLCPRCRDILLTTVAIEVHERELLVSQ